MMIQITRITQFDSIGTSDGYACLAAWTPSFWELGIILFIAILLFGNRLPSIARSMGKGITEFKKGLRDTDDEPKPPAKSGDGA